MLPTSVPVPSSSGVDVNDDNNNPQQQQQQQQELLEEVLDTILQSPNFSVAWYLNTALKRHDDEDQLQMKMAELALQLQLQTQTCHEEIGKIGIELQAIMPRCSADVNRISVGLNGLKQDAQQLLYKTTGNTASKASITTVKKIEKNEKEGKIDDSAERPMSDESHRSTTSVGTGIVGMSSMETLSTLHALQANLTRTKEILTAAATWDTTVSSIAPLLVNASNNTANSTGLIQAVQALVQLEHGERALRGMPNPEERRESINKIRIQVSSLLQPQLKNALISMNTNNKLQPLQQCVLLYGQLNQIHILKNEYIKQRPIMNNIHKVWFEYNPSTQNFVEWLPSWFDLVFNLITEERRQSTIIFSKQYIELVPEIVIRVFAECFRPIMPSFKSRLEGICSTVSINFPTPTTAPKSALTSTPTAQPITTTTPVNKGSLSDICTVYENMLRFLSLVYESITGGWLDMAESFPAVKQQLEGGNQTNKSVGIIINNAPTLYRELTNVFIHVSTPFIAYQKSLAQLETKFLGMQSRELVHQIQQDVVATVSSNSTSGDVGGGWEALQSGSMGRLLDLSRQIIPIAEGAVARFELFNGGYNVTAALQVIDKVLAGYASELALAIHKLSSITSGESDTDNNSLDEAHVLCALHVLKVAGSYYRDMKSLQSKTRERLQLLSERMIAHLAREKQLDEALQKLSTGGKVNFQLPDSLSIVEIDSLLTKSSFIGDASTDTASSTDVASANAPLVVLQRLANTSHTMEEILYPEADESSIRLATSCHTFVFDVCYGVPRFHLNGMSSMPAWKEKQANGDPTSYGTLPQSYITQVGEHMLALVQALEPFAADLNSLNLANEMMDIEMLRRVTYQPWFDFIAAASGTAGTEQLVKTLMDGKDLLDFVIGAVPLEDDDEDDDSNEDKALVHDEHVKASTTFCNKWLDVIGLAVTGRLLERIMRIPSLTLLGCEHLHADLGYVVNVFSALGISGHPHPLLGHVAEICKVDKDVVSERINNLDRTNQSANFLRDVEERLSAMRGLTNKY